MTANAATGDRTLRHLGRRVVRAAGAEIGRARRDVLRIGQHRLELPQPADPRRDLVGMADSLEHAFTKRDGDIVGVERPAGGEQLLAAVVALADDHGARRRGIKMLAKLRFDQRPLLLDDDDRLQAFGEFGDVFVVERPRTGDLEQPYAKPVRRRLVDAKIVERLTDIEIALADGRDADLRSLAALVDDPVETVGPNERSRRSPLVVVEPLFLAELVEFMANVEPAGRQIDFRQDDVQAIKRHVDRRGRFDVVLDAFDRCPGSRETRQREAVEAVIDQFLDAGRIEDRHHRVDEGEFGGMGIGGGFGGVVVAHQRQHAAMFR